MHIQSITFYPDQFPVKDVYPFCIPIFRNTASIPLENNITFLTGENAAGKSTLLRAIAMRCGIHIWDESGKSRYGYNPMENDLYKYLDIGWEKKPQNGAFFSAETYRHLAKNVDEWASTDPGLLSYFGGRSLVAQSHGESFMAYFRSRFGIEGLYLLDEPESALSPKRQLEFIHLIREMSREGRAQFLIASHSPILLSSPQSTLLSLDGFSVNKIDFRNTDYFSVYREVLRNCENPGDNAV